MSQTNTVGIFGKAKHPDVEALARKLSRLALEHGWKVLVEPDLGEGVSGAGRASAEEVAARSDIVVVLGGDGTMIRVTRLLGNKEVPIFGVNLGFLGFLTEFTTEEAPVHFSRLLDGKFDVERRVRLRAALLRKDQQVIAVDVLNEAVVGSGIARIVLVHVEINGVYVTSCRGDGLIVATPTGSTAYSMAAGGPILVPETPALVVAPICPHTLTMRPLVVDDRAKIQIWVERTHDHEKLQATFDGQQEQEILPGDRLCIERAQAGVLLVKPPRDYYQILRAKLKWGQG